MCEVEQEMPDQPNYEEPVVLNDQENGLSESAFYIEPTHIDDYDPEFVAELLAEVPSSIAISPSPLIGASEPVPNDQLQEELVSDIPVISLDGSIATIDDISSHGNDATRESTRLGQFEKDTKTYTTTDKPENIPSQVQEFISYLYRKYTEKSVYDMFLLYENSFYKLSDKYYQKETWPSVNIVSGIFHKDPLFTSLYTELYYRHIHIKLSPTMEQRSESFRQYSILFQLLIDAPNDFVLPNQWVWDIFDEYLYQFQTYHSMLCKNTRINKQSGDIIDQSLVESDTRDVCNEGTDWNHQSVLNILARFVERSNIRQCLMNEHEQSDSSIFSRNMGYFALISILRLYVLVGKFAEALTLIIGLDLGKRDVIPRVISCQLATFHYSGVAYLMSGRYLDSIKSFTSVLAFITRPKQLQISSKTRFYDHMMKKTDQMYALLAICTFIFPFKLEDNIQTTLKEKFGNEISTLQSGNVPKVLEDLFCFGTPKFVFPAPNPMGFHFNNFYEAVKVQLKICTLRDYLVLYKSISLTKLAKFLYQSTDEVKKLLVSFKRQIIATSNIDTSEYSRFDDDTLLSQPYSQKFNIGFDFYIKEASDQCMY